MTREQAARMAEALAPFAELWKGISRGSRSGELADVEVTDELFSFSDGTNEYRINIYQLRNAHRALVGKDLIDPFETKRRAGPMNPELAAKVKARKAKLKRRAKAQANPLPQKESERDRLAREALGW